MELDGIDRRIIEILGHDANVSSETIAKELNMSSAGIRRRIAKLMRGNVLKIFAAVEPKAVGLNYTAMVGLDVDPDKISSALEVLYRRPEVMWVASTTGRFDIMALTRFNSTEELYQFIQTVLPSIAGLRDTETYTCLHIKKISGRPIYMDFREP